MTSVAFHSPDHDTIRVGGAERIWASLLCTRIMHGVLGLADSPALDRPPLDRLLRMVPDGHYLHDYARRGDVEGTARLMRSALGGYADCLTWNGHHVNEFTLALNTALVIGGDALRFSARVHGSCEIHGWVNGPNRAWLADVVEEGLASGVLRRAHQTQYENDQTVQRDGRGRARRPRRRGRSLGRAGRGHPVGAGVHRAAGRGRGLGDPTGGLDDLPVLALPVGL